MQRLLLITVLVVGCWHATRARAAGPNPDLRLAVEIYDAQLPQVDRLVTAGAAKDRVLAVRSCFETLRVGDRETAHTQLAAAEEQAALQAADAPSLLAELESVAAAALALADCDTNRAASIRPPQARCHDVLAKRPNPTPAQAMVPAKPPRSPTLPQQPPAEAVGIQASKQGM
ncbi:hypothetical protein Pla123a_09250 [Posidoniimonas polymericola]|uniref:Uncharacterized protein n=1 Tax=Posidoniimonas polymericola TaxID=2528002 RepID=A0A5C5YT50_9BACT|nr:hypothetical protein [Posidoniimonas polymericola]TWT78135.1 hypothetical protein Pla123a_09250 [Posidoniimonas polymericola]